MKAVQINKYGGAEVLEINRNVLEPVLKPGQMLVENYAAGINPFDVKVRAGTLQKVTSKYLPFTIGGDFAGIVTEKAEDVSGFSPGDEVYGQAVILNGGSGSMAEMVAVNAANTARKPKSADFSESAGLPLAGTSAVQALEEHIKLQRGQKILIHGGAGGIGHIAVQLAKAIGAYVATTVSGDDADFVKGLGADEVIDYKIQKFEEMLRDFDAVFDTVGGETMEKSFRVIKKGGILVSMAGHPDEKLAEQKYGVIAIAQQTRTDTSHLQRLGDLVDSGKIKVHIDKSFPLEQVQDAFRYQEESHPRGKVVVEIR